MKKKLTREQARRLIRETGNRVTSPRVAVLRALGAANKPMSHGEVVEKMDGEGWDQATVYRNLQKLAEAGLARVASNVGGVVRYAASWENDEPHLHPHFACRLCGSVACLRGAELAGSVSRRWKQSVATSEMQLVGDCPECLDRRKQSGKRAGRYG